MDFNTGTGGTGGGSPSEPSGPPPRRSGAATGGEFNYQDPVQSFISTVQRVVLQPVDFFRGMVRQGDFLNPLIFALICWEIAAILGGILTILAAMVGIGTRGVGGALGSFVGSLFLTPIVAAIVVLVGAGILHLLVMLIVKPVGSGFETTFRVVSYAWVAQLVYWIPIVGWIVGAVAWVILAIFGIREAHSTTTGKAAVVVLIPVVVFGGLALLIVGAALFAIFAGSR